MSEMRTMEHAALFGKLCASLAPAPIPELTFGQWCRAVPVDEMPMAVFLTGRPHVFCQRAMIGKCECGRRIEWHFRFGSDCPFDELRLRCVCGGAVVLNPAGLLSVVRIQTIDEQRAMQAMGGRWI